MMKELRKERYFQKLTHFDQYLSLLNDWIKDNKVKIQDDPAHYQLLFSIYHAFQLLMEVVANISAMIVKDTDHFSKDDYSNYQRLFSLKIINRDEFQELKNLNGLRHRVVHDYNGIIDQIAFEGIRNNLGFFHVIKERFELWLSKQ